MSTLDDAAPSRVRRLIHHATAGWLTWLIVANLNDVIGHYYPNPIHTFTESQHWTWTIATGIINMALICGYLLHNLNICSLCNTIEINPSATAERFHRSFRILHFVFLDLVDVARARIGAMLVNLLLGIVVVVGVPVLIAMLAPEPYNSMALMVIAVWWILSMQRHQRYRLWCPYCRRGGRGGRHEAPTPAPDPAGTITRS